MLDASSYNRLKLRRNRVVTRRLTRYPVVFPTGSTACRTVRKSGRATLVLGRCPAPGTRRRRPAAPALAFLRVVGVGRHCSCRLPPRISFTAHFTSTERSLCMHRHRSCPRGQGRVGVAGPSRGAVLRFQGFQSLARRPRRRRRVLIEPLRPGRVLGASVEAHCMLGHPSQRGGSPIRRECAS